jgi:hypothetical protein
MKKENLIWIGVGAVALIGFVLVFSNRRRRKAVEIAEATIIETKTETPTKNGGQPQVTSQKIDFSKTKFPIKKGKKGGDVQKLQLLLLQYDKNLLPKFGADGDFGSETASALKSVIGKELIESQKDIDAIYDAGKKKAGNALLNAQIFGGFGIKNPIKIV